MIKKYFLKIDNFVRFFNEPKSLGKIKNFKIGDFFIIFSITLIIIAPYTALIYALGLNELENEVMDLLRENPFFLLLIAVFIAPILEEPVYRLHLDLKKKSIYWGLGLSLLLIDEFWYPLAALWIYLIWLLIRVNKDNPPSLKFVVYSSAILFGLVHLGNFTNLDYTKQFYLIPLLVGGQVFVGLVISFIRLTYGMKWAIIFHGVYNGILIGSYLLFFQDL
ncbi:CAAX protease self-immunity [Algoriphagus faecimaris]|uniref:CAAX protease self-immunity n=1 Tax=Algoriphagus faecimaris TaxID=686796 RepID=A0A1G6MUP9_9BACT|nr:CPBP family glutamic-type intramembrane protease [Algoriphagus faecimaris]SDC59161.1 CAAX protease self-immunity [Algoriphagus faecimaris]